MHRQSDFTQSRVVFRIIVVHVKIRRFVIASVARIASRHLSSLSRVVDRCTQTTSVCLCASALDSVADGSHGRRPPEGAARYIDGGCRLRHTHTRLLRATDERETEWLIGQQIWRDWILTALLNADFHASPTLGSRRPKKASRFFLQRSCVNTLGMCLSGDGEGPLEISGT